jgi:CubicO group peptidase (beta-lactamase class C family)
VSVDDARRVIEDAVAARVFPAACVEVGAADRLLWSEPFGHLTFAPDAPAATHDTIYDLASLTKPISTTTIVMELIRTGALTLEALVADRFAEWRGVDREAVTVRDMLEHASGLPARLVDAPPQTRREFAHDICTMPLEYEPRTRSIYSDLGFILLGFLAADLGGAALAELFDQITVRLKPDTTEESNDSSADSGSVRPPPSHEASADHRSLGEGGQADLLSFDLAPAERIHAAPTRPMDKDARRGRDLVGEVHDNYAAALGGVAGHAGLFGNVPAVGEYARLLLRAARGDASIAAPFSPELVRLFTTKSAVPDSSRALGWDTMLPTSSCGTRMSPQAFGHVGFTGTSLWIDPVRDRYFVLLTNRVLGGGTLDQMRTVRRAFHDALGDV